MKNTRQKLKKRPKRNSDRGKALSWRQKQKEARADAAGNGAAQLLDCKNSGFDSKAGNCIEGSPRNPPRPGSQLIPGAKLRTTSDLECIFSALEVRKVIAPQQKINTQNGGTRHFPESRQAQFLRGLKQFLRVLFTYQPVCLGDLAALSSAERLILNLIFEGKNYAMAKQLSESIALKRRDPGIWLEFHKERRKEENLKTGFKFLLELLQLRFEKQNMLMLQEPADQDRQELFYLHFFAAPGLPPSISRTMDAFAAIRGKTGKRKEQALKGIQGYIFPEHVSRCAFSGTKTISRNFLARLAESEHFVSELLVTTLEAVLFCGFCMAHDWQRCGWEVFESQMTRTGVGLLKLVARENLGDLETIFSVWEKKFEAKVKGASDISFRRGFFEIMQKSIRRKNFKFPWTFRELRSALVESLLALVEVFKIHRFSASAEGSD